MTLASDYSRCIKQLDNLFRCYPGPAFAIRLPLWSWHSSPGEARFALVMRSQKTFDKLMRPSETGLGEAFISGDLDVEGDIFSAFDMAEWLLSRSPSLRNRVAAELHRDCFMALSFLTRGWKHSRHRDADSISHHYDLPVEFYEPWLGPTLVYSSAYFRDAAERLDTAQEDKLDLICRKLELRPGDRFMDLGCGWGSLAIHAATQYGAQTRGITVSRSQARVAARRISESQVGDRCFVEYRDYRDAPDLPWKFDKLASIGMFEHVGVSNLPTYFQCAFDLLKPGGLFLNSGIVRAADSPRRKQSFIDEYVFPDGELGTLAETLRAAEEAGFEIRDVETLREHYALTLRRWVENLQRHAPELLETVSKRTLRTWLLYMAGSAAAFERADISVCQVLLRRRDHRRNARISTRESWYTNSQSQSQQPAA